MRCQFLVAAAALCVAAPASAATYVVSPQGSDNANGTSNPFRTVQKAMSVLRSGDTILIKQGTYASGFTLKGLSNITIRGEGDVLLDGRQSNQSDGLMLFRVQNITLENIRLQNHARNGVYAEDGQGMVVRNCNFSNNGRTGFLTASVSDITIERCTSNNNRDEHGIYFSGAGARHKVRYNLCSNNGKAGLQINAGGDGIADGCLVEGNIFHSNNNVGGSGINLASVRNSLFVNNLVYNAGKSAGGIAGWDDGAGSSYGTKNNRFYHNTIVLDRAAKYGFSFVNGSTGNQLRNNIIVCAGSDAIRTNDPVDSDYNCFSAASVGNGQSLSNWRRSTGNDANSIEADPRLTRDYRLSAGSPCIDVGTHLYQNDQDGTLRPQGPNPDLGCYEFKSGNTPQPPQQPQPPQPPTTTKAVIYDDALASQWTVNAYQANGTINSTNQVAQGRNSIALKINRDGGYMRLLGPGVSANGKSTLKFLVHGGGKGGQRLWLRLFANGEKQASVRLDRYANIRAGKWTEVSVPLADLGVSGGSVTGFQLAATTPQNRVFIDYIRLE